MKKNLTYTIRCCVFDVFKHLGAGFLETVYEKVLLIELNRKGIKVELKAQILNYLKATGIKVGLLINFTHPKAEIKRYIL